MGPWYKKSTSVGIVGNRSRFSQVFIKLIVGGAMVHEIYISENSGESILFLSDIYKTTSRWGHGT